MSLTHLNHSPDLRSSEDSVSSGEALSVLSVHSSVAGTFGPH